MNHPHTPIARWARLILLALAPVLATAQSLPPTVEADRQLKAAGDEMRQDTIDWKRALAALTAAEATGVKMPESFDFHMGMVLNETGDYAGAMQRLTRYLERYARRGRFYDAALEQLNLAERRQAQKLEAEQRARKADEDRIAAEAAKRISDRLAARKTYDEALARYERDVQNCPDRFRERVEDARRDYRKTEQACMSTISPGQNICDMHEAQNDRYVTVGSTAQRTRARARLEELNATSSEAWCKGRHTRPTLPAILAEDTPQKKYYRRWDRSQEPLLTCDPHIQTWVYHRLGKQAPRDFQCACPSANECKGSFAFDPRQGQSANFASDELTKPFGFEFKDSPF